MDVPMNRLLQVVLGMTLATSAVIAADGPTATSVPASAPATAPATTTASYAGTFSDGRLTVVLGVAPPEKAKQGEYVGTITLDGKTYEAVASPKDSGIAGTFRVGGNPFQFTATYEQGGLMLQSADATYHLKDITPPAVPATMPATLPATTQTSSQTSTQTSTKDDSGR